MIYKVISKTEFNCFLDALAQSNTAFGPCRVESNIHGESIYQFRQVTSASQLALDYSVTASSAKHFFLPFREELSRFIFREKEWEQQVACEADPIVLIGLRACDIAALNILDDVLLNGNFPSPFYLARRKNTFVIGMDHMPLPDCFCKSMNHHTVPTGFNLFCSDIGEEYYLSINSSKAYSFLKEFETREPRSRENSLLMERRNLIKKSFQTEIEVSGLPDILDIEFDSQVWEKWGARCLNCGSCAMVCPTCYCYSVTESFACNLQGASRQKTLYSCNLVDFAQVAGGHNFRPKNGDRLKYRYYHQHRGFAENANQQICVGCNRCGRVCLAGINPKDVINDLRMEKESCTTGDSSSPTSR